MLIVFSFYQLRPYWLTPCTPDGSGRFCLVGRGIEMKLFWSDFVASGSLSLKTGKTCGFRSADELLAVDF